MSHTVEWLLSERVILVNLEGDLTIDDLEDFSNDIVSLLEEGQSPVHIMISDANVGKIPVQLNQVQKKLGFIRHPALGWLVAVGEVNPLINYIVPTIMKIAGVSYARRHSQEDALRLIYHHDPTVATER